MQLYYLQIWQIVANFFEKVFQNLIYYGQSRAKLLIYELDACLWLIVIKKLFLRALTGALTWRI